MLDKLMCNRKGYLVYNYTYLRVYDKRSCGLTRTYTTQAEREKQQWVVIKYTINKSKLLEQVFVEIRFPI